MREIRKQTNQRLFHNDFDIDENDSSSWWNKFNDDKKTKFKHSFNKKVIIENETVFWKTQIAQHSVSFSYFNADFGVGLVFFNESNCIAFVVLCWWFGSFFVMFGSIVLFISMFC